VEEAGLRPTAERVKEGEREGRERERERERYSFILFVRERKMCIFV
jgi:hypothetical protein